MKSCGSVAISILLALLIISPATAQQASKAGNRSLSLAQPLTSQHEVLNRTLSVKLENVTVEEALERIASAAMVDISYSRDVVALGRRVSLRVSDASVRDVLNQVLAAQNLSLMVGPSGQIVLAEGDGAGTASPPQAVPPQPLGVIVGRVTAASGGPLSGASVTLERTQFSEVTDDTGRFRIAGVPAGTYAVAVQQLGYAEAQKSVTVTDGQEATVDFELEVAALPLDELVATGTAFATRVRTVPNPIAVITAQDIERKQATSITELLRGEIPGVIALSPGQSDYFSRIFVRGNASWTGGDYIKIYIDGVEVASQDYLSTIDPKSIERIEVVRGPQASAIYGSEASSGVLQIFTKKGRPGTDGPRLDLQASVGAIESEYTPSSVGRPMAQDHSLGVSGGGEAFSYRAGASYASVGEWLTGYGSSTLSFSGGLRAVHGPLTAELTALWSDRDLDRGTDPIWRRFPQTISCPYCGQPDLVYLNYNYALSQNTMGLTLKYRATEQWQHTLTLGDDQNRWGYHQSEPNHITPADTFVGLSNREFRRRSIRYHTAYEADLSGSVTGRLTAGVDYWSYDVQGSGGSNLLNAFGAIRTSPSTSASFDNDAWWNAGYFGMAELGFRDHFFVTLAARVEDNPHLGEEYGRAVSPRIGASYVRAMGAAEVKLRAQYGKGVRPPPAYARPGGLLGTTLYVANPEIGPEEKVGWDAGVDVYWGDRGSVSLTRYSEDGKNLIQAVDLDLTVMPRIRQYQNIGRVGSKGWEVEGELNLGPLTLQANYAYSDNVILTLSNQYVEGPNQVYQVGDRMEYVPKHSGGGTATWRLWRGSASVNASVMDDWRSLDYIPYLGYVFGVEPYRGSIREYYVNNSEALWKWNLKTDQQLTARWAVFARIDNLANNQAADLDNLNVTPGRTTVVGVRWTH